MFSELSKNIPICLKDRKLYGDNCCSQPRALLIYDHATNHKTGGEAKKIPFIFEPTIDEINGDLSLTYVGDELGHNDGNLTHFSMPKCDEKL